MRVEEISSDEIILRRIPPPESENTQPRKEGGRRPNSQRLQLLKPDDPGLSCTRLKQTSPRQLLDQLLDQGKDPDGWMVCRLYVADVRELGLDVVHRPESGDPGHCHIHGTDKTLFGRKTSRHLAKKARILRKDEIESGEVVD